jgi:hypothetical protein
VIDILSISSAAPVCTSIIIAYELLAGSFTNLVHIDAIPANASQLSSSSLKVWDCGGGAIKSGPSPLNGNELEMRNTICPCGDFSLTANASILPTYVPGILIIYRSKLFVLSCNREIVNGSPLLRWHIVDHFL